MGIVLKWKTKLLLSDTPRLILTVLSIAGAFAMLVAMGLSIESHMSFIGSTSRGLTYLVVAAFRITMLVTYAFTLYVLFTVSLAERKNQLRIMRASGATNRQLLKGLVFEASALDVIGAALGIGAGFLFARLLLRGVDIPLQPALFWSKEILLYSVLPAFLLPPVIVLLSAPSLLRQKNGVRRKKPRGSRGDPFKKMSFSRLFGSGGVLERTLGKQQRYHRFLLVGAIVINVMAMFLITAGFSILSHMESSEKFDMEIEFNSYFSGADHHGADADQLNRRMSQVLEDCRAEGLLQDYRRMQTNILYTCVVNDTDLTDSFLSFMDGSQSFSKLNSSQHFLALSLTIIPDKEFDSFIKEYSIPYSGKGGIYIDRFVDGSDGGQKKRFECMPDEDDIVLYSCPYYDLFEKSPNGTIITNRLPDAEAILFENSESMNIKPEVILSDPDTIEALNRFYSKSYFGYSPFYFDLLLPERLKETIVPFLGKNESFSLKYDYTVQATNSKMIYQRLEDSLNGEYGYIFCPYQFSDNVGYYNKLEQIQEKTVRVFDHKATELDRQDFMTQVDQIYYFFIITVFLMIALNIINVVHMNRLSRRREYAILTSLGLGARQRLGMTLYESFRLTAGSVLCGLISIIVAAKFIYPIFNHYFIVGEEYRITNQEYLSGDYTVIDELLMVAKDLWLAIKPHWYLIVLAILFVFLGFALTERLVDKRFERDELVAVLKDDMHE